MSKRNVIYFQSSPLPKIRAAFFDKKSRNSVVLQSFGLHVHASTSPLVLVNGFCCCARLASARSRASRAVPCRVFSRTRRSKDNRPRDRGCAWLILVVWCSWDAGSTIKQKPRSGVHDHATTAKASSARLTWQNVDAIRAGKRWRIHPRRKRIGNGTYHLRRTRQRDSQARSRDVAVCAIGRRRGR